MRSFLGLCNYYRKFIEKYAEKSRLLEAICGKNNDKLVWSQDCDESLLQTPVLAFPDFQREFIFYTDYNFNTIGAVLSQKDDSGEQIVITYESDAMNAHERGYCITRKELLAFIISRNTLIIIYMVKGLNFTQIVKQ